MKIYVNWSYNANADKFSILQLPYVMAGEKVAILDTELKINEPLVVEDDYGNCYVFDRKTYEETHRKFFLRINKDGTLVEAKPGEEYHLFRWYTKDTDVSKLRYNGREVIMVDTEEEQPQPNEKRDRKKEN